MEKGFVIFMILGMALCQILHGYQENPALPVEEVVTMECEVVPFQVVVDKTPLESGQEETITCMILADKKDFSYIVSAENGKISNKDISSFDYTKPKEGVFDTICVECTDNATGRKYSFSIPLFFTTPATEVQLDILK